MKKITGFYAYPSSPTEIGHGIEQANKEIKLSASEISISTWKALDVIGHFITDEVISGINTTDFLVADISKLNFNVVYEIGYAIGKSKRVLLTKNISINETKPTIQEVGIFDTIGYKEYQNSAELHSYLTDIENINPIDVATPINIKAPVYLIDTMYKTDWATRIVSRIKKSGYIFRTFDPNETPRLSAYDAINQVSQSYGVIVPLLSANTNGHEVHNMRGAFIAGLSDGMNKALCIIQNGDAPVPVDYRDFVNISYHPNDVNEIIAEFSSKVAIAFQQVESTKKSVKKSLLKKLNLGATSAENEMRDLENYYLETDQYLKSLRGEAHLVVGRKGAGKSAIFLQIRDKERERNRSQNIVLDLKPDGYKLVKFKEQILNFLQEGTYQHTIMAFWEYVLLLEICYKIIEKDKQRHIHDHLLFDQYRKLSNLYNTEEYSSVGDFSERMSCLMEKIYSDYQALYKNEKEVSLTSAQVTELIHKHDVKKLTDELISYMEHKGSLWLLFDNIDKGWPTTGLQHEDLLIIRALIDATRKIERQFTRKNLNVNTIIFLRNDVYELLVRETSDRGKEASVALDWTDPDLLRELIRLRIISNDIEARNFQSAWLKIFVSHYKGEETSQYLIDRSLMRPRFLLNLINQCKSFAINLNHEIIEENDIEKGVSAYSSDLLSDIGYELRDISQESEDVLYAFIGCKKDISKDDVIVILDEFGINKDIADKIFHLLIWYGFLGIRLNSDEPKYIYDFNYNMQLLDGIIRKSKKSLTFTINPAFWASLMIEDE